MGTRTFSLRGTTGASPYMDDFEVAYRRMVAAGVRFRGEPRDDAYGRNVVFYDIAGKPWDLLGPAT